MSTKQLIRAVLRGEVLKFASEVRVSRTMAVLRSECATGWPHSTAEQRTPARAMADGGP